MDFSPLSIRISNTQKDLRISSAGLRALVEEVLKFTATSCREVSICFVSKRRIGQLHERFFSDPSPTDCISCPIDSEVLGEVFVCPKVAIEYARDHALDPYEETALYVIHGLLHLLGYDDLEPSEKRTMRKKEKQCMAHIKRLSISLRPA